LSNFYYRELTLLTGHGKADGQVGEESLGRMSYQGHGNGWHESQRSAWGKGQSAIVSDPDETLLSYVRRVRGIDIVIRPCLGLRIRQLCSHIEILSGIRLSIESHRIWT